MEDFYVLNMKDKIKIFKASVNEKIYDI